jgi:hypothetical protein
VSNITEPFGFAVDLMFKKSFLDQLGVIMVDELLVRHHSGCRVWAESSFMATNCTPGMYRVRSLDHCRGCPGGPQITS